MILIRLATKKDIPGILEIYSPLVRTTAVSFEFEAPDEKEFARRMTTIKKKFPWLVCQWHETIAGYAYAGPHRARQAYQWTAELSVYVHRGFQRRKIATALYKTLMDLLVLQGYRNALAGITLPNKASVVFHESLGFSPVGVYHNVGYKLGSWHSAGWWEMPLGRSQGAPKKLKTPAEIRNTPVWQSAIKKGMKELTALGKP